MVSIMKRDKSSMLMHSKHFHFLLKEDLGSDYAKRLVQEEVKKYKTGLLKAGTKHKILSEETLTGRLCSN